jgi:hypothetical protein
MIFFNKEFDEYNIAYHEDIFQLQIKKIMFLFYQQTLRVYVGDDNYKCSMFNVKLPQLCKCVSVEDFIEFMIKNKEEIERSVILSSVNINVNNLYKDYIEDFLRANYKHYDLVKVMV